ncbi:MFS transporter [Nocardia sp. BSTN01]|uniref:MFS transporter n=1 Tax=Nocardia sp. BSTN01 TaxID=2783665 RepID=UPI001890552D|nr:MFS transporter [Nocardia sp. BSTN01]MBF5001367.1 MFS transporter [Nocardia sp. BSTN01]
MSTPTLLARGTRPASAPPARATLLVLLAGIFMATLDFFIVNVAIPDTQADLHASSATMQWVVAGYGLAVAAGLITGGRLGDLYGRRRLYGLGMAVFTLASLACALAGDAAELVVARIAQGAGMALLMPQVLGIISVVFTGTRRVRAFAAYGLAMGLAAVFGQLIGGLLIQADLFGLGWRTIFWINVPVGALTLAVLARLVPESRGDGGTRLDRLGVGLIATALAAVVLPLIQGREQGWPLWTWLALAAAAVLIAVFVTAARRSAARGGEPLVDPALFTERSFAIGSAIALSYQMTMGSFFLVLALYLQQGRGLSALGSGLLFLALGGAYLFTSILSERAAARLGRQVVAVGAVLQAGGYLLLAITAHELGADGSVLDLLPGMIVAGAGMGLALVPMPGIVLAGVTPRHAAAAGGVLATAQQVGGAVGIAVVGIVFYDRLAAPGGLAPAFVASLVPMALLCLLTAALVQLLPAARIRK